MIVWGDALTICIVMLISLKELDRPPPFPRGQTSAQARYLIANANVA